MYRFNDLSCHSLAGVRKALDREKEKLAQVERALRGNAAASKDSIGQLREGRKHRLKDNFDGLLVRRDALARKIKALSASLERMEGKRS
jgi:hypothetical protein